MAYSHKMDSERMPPTKDMLPAFLVNKARQPSGDGVIRMKKSEYDSLLAREPRAALRYVDESDGEVILVRSTPIPSRCPTYLDVR